MTTTDEQYVPSDEDMRKRHRYAWEQSPVNRHALDEADAQWSRWLAAHDARVRRDAARSALDGLAEQYEHDAYIRAYRDTHYPKEAP